MLLRRLRCAALGLLLPALAWAGPACRIAYDMGSSGIRAGSTVSVVTTQVDIDYLGPLWAGRGLDETIPATIAALDNLPARARFPTNCVRVGGGFSAWRLALERDPEKLAASLAQIHAASGVAVLPIPQITEGAYGYVGAYRALGEGLTTSHILDIGGGSLQIAGQRTTYGAMLGQKAWHNRLCQALRNAETFPCTLQPMTDDDLALARRLASESLQGIPAALPEPVTMTAISRPVTQGVVPAVRRNVSPDAVRNGVRSADLAATIDRLAPLTLTDTAALVGTPLRYATYLFSDLLLVEGVLAAAGSDTLRVAEVDLTNIPGLLADDRAYRWAERYGCYLERLRHLGLAAYDSDPATCPAP